VKFPGRYGRYSFRPKIKARESCEYSFYLRHVQKPFGGKSGFFVPKTRNNRKEYTAKGKNSALAREEPRIPAIVKRVGVNVERKDFYMLDIGFYENVIHELASFKANQGGIKPSADVITADWNAYTSMRSDFTGKITVYRDGQPYHRIIQYGESDSFSRHFGIAGIPQFTGYYARSYSFNVDELGVYTFIPEMKSEGDFKFSLSISRKKWR
jgi:hypothetical protein